MNTILFILPEYYEIPIGGYKVVFEYANRLVRDGHCVKIVYPSFLFFKKSSLKRKLKMLFFFLYYKIIKRKGVNSWFPLDKNISVYYTPTLNQKFIPSADIYVATAMETACHLNSYTFIDVQRKFYLIQALEDWQWGKEAALATWKFPLNKIVVSPWLYSIAESLGVNATIIENGIDRDGFINIIQQKERDKKTVLMLYHQQKLKGCDEGLRALMQVKKNEPDLKAIWFGTRRRPQNLPRWIEYHQKPSNIQLRDLYNRASIFLGTSHSEGFGLTVGEAMLCGCAVVCTNAGGYLTMAKHMDTAVVNNIGDTDAMANNIMMLINDDELRQSIAANGNEFIRRFTWDRAYEKFKHSMNL